MWKIAFTKTSNLLVKKMQVEETTLMRMDTVVVEPEPTYESLRVFLHEHPNVKNFKNAFRSDKDEVNTKTTDDGIQIIMMGTCKENNYGDSDEENLEMAYAYDTKQNMRIDAKRFKTGYDGLLLGGAWVKRKGDHVLFKPEKIYRATPNVQVYVLVGHLVPTKY